MRNAKRNCNRERISNRANGNNLHAKIKKEIISMTQLNEQERALVGLIAEGCTSTAEITAKLKGLFSGALEKMLEAEMDEHLGYDKHSVIGNNSGNSRNGYGKKTIKSEWGESEIAIPRDRNGSIESGFAGFTNIINTGRRPGDAGPTPGRRPKGRL
jgi:hypothetical protein